MSEPAPDDLAAHRQRTVDALTTLLVRARPREGQSFGGYMVGTLGLFDLRLDELDAAILAAGRRSQRQLRGDD